MKFYDTTTIGETLNSDEEKLLIVAKSCKNKDISEQISTFINKMHVKSEKNITIKKI
jgi:hypothetical protein